MQMNTWRQPHEAFGGRGQNKVAVNNESRWPYWLAEPKAGFHCRQIMVLRDRGVKSDPLKLIKACCISVDFF